MSTCIVCGTVGPICNFDQYHVPYWFSRFCDVDYVLICNTRSSNCASIQRNRCLPQKLSSKSSSDFDDIIDAKSAIVKLIDLLSGYNTVPDWNRSIANSLSNLKSDGMTTPSFKIITRPTFMLNWNQHRYITTNSHCFSDDDSFDC
jgi:hypothetical protein